MSINPLQPINKLFGFGTKGASAQQAWIDNGGPQNQARIAAAVMKAESGCDNHADNKICCVCAMQVNVKAHPQYKADDLKSNLDTCMKAAVAIWNEQGWAAWQSYTSGAYKKYLGSDCEVKNAYKASFGSTVGGHAITGGMPPSDVVPGLSVLGDIANFFHLLTQASTWLRVGKVMLGVLLFAIVIYMLLKG